MSDSNFNESNIIGESAPTPNHDVLQAERRQFASDRSSLRQLGLTLDRLTTRSLRKFAELITGDPLLRQVLIYRTPENSYAALMARAGHGAASHPAVRPHEQEALYAAALVARIPDWIALHGVRCRSGLLDLPDLPDSPDSPALSALLRRCNYFFNSALMRLHTSDPRSAPVVFSALGVTHPSQVDHLHSDRLAAIVRQAWQEVWPAAQLSSESNALFGSSTAPFTTL